MKENFPSNLMKLSIIYAIITCICTMSAGFIKAFQNEVAAENVSNSHRELFTWFFIYWREKAGSKRSFTDRVLHVSRTYSKYCETMVKAACQYYKRRSFVKYFFMFACILTTCISAKAVPKLRETPIDFCFVLF